MSEKWITVNGRHVQVDDDGKIVGKSIQKKKSTGYKSPLDKANKHNPKEHKGKNK